MKKLKISLLYALALTEIFITAACNHGTQAGGGYAPVPYEFAPVPAGVITGTDPTCPEHSSFTKAYLLQGAR